MINEHQIDFSGMTTNCVEQIAIDALNALIGFADADIEQSVDNEAPVQAIEDRRRRRQYKAAKAALNVAPHR